MAQRESEQSWRWGVLGTANIARRAFLPALRAAGGRAVRVGSRDRDRASEWALENEVEAAGDYASVLADDIDAVYVALPNDQHLEWAERAAAAGKVVLCEKPFGLTADAVAAAVASIGPDARVWEALVFAFHPQTALVADLVADGRIGALAQIDSEFHIRVPDAPNLRWEAEHGGGALLDVGCYCLRLARLLFADEPTHAAGLAHRHARGVEDRAAGVVDFAYGGRLVWSAGFDRGSSTFTRVVGTEGELRLTNPFHPTSTDTVSLWRGGACEQQWPAPAGSAFEHAVRHIHDVLDGSAPPRHLIGDDAVQQARALDLMRAGLTTVAR